MTPFSGVRISWLMVARNSDLCRDASIAASRACASCAWALALRHPGQLLATCLAIVSISSNRNRAAPR